MLNHRALMSRKVFAPESTSSSLFPPSNIEVLRQVTDSNEPTTSSFNNSIPKTTKKEIATEPLEVVLSKMAANIQQTIAEKQLDVDQDHRWIINNVKLIHLF
jgi:translation initiation factor 2B subunit (eIF-2B alpha/beta/delta family)